MGKLFGTDGIRGIVGEDLTHELAMKVGEAAAYVLGGKKDLVVLIGRDTRISGTLIESAMTAGFLSYGANVKLLGVMPTPAVAYLTKKTKADASVVISASHNTFEFNGVKYTGKYERSIVGRAMSFTTQIFRTDEGFSFSIRSDTQQLISFIAMNKEEGFSAEEFTPEEMGFTLNIGPEAEFFLFRTDENGEWIFVMLSEEDM